MIFQKTCYGTIEDNDSAYARTSLLKVGGIVVKLDSNRTMFNSNGQRITDIGSAIIYDAIKMEETDAN